MSDRGSQNRDIEPVKEPVIVETIDTLKNAIEVKELTLKLRDLDTKLALMEPKEGSKKVAREDIQNLSVSQQTALMLDYRGVKYAGSGQKFADGNVMMEGPLDHASNQGPTERFMQLWIDPYKFAILARFTSIGQRITYAVYEDAWAGGLSLNLRGKDMDEKQQEINEKLHAHWSKIGLQEVWELAGGYKREGGDSIIVLHFEGEIAAKVGKSSSGVNIHNFGYMERQAPRKNVAALDAYSKLDYTVLEDDGKGHPYMYQITLFLGKMTGSQIVNVHHSRVIQLKRQKTERSFEGTSVQQACYNEEVIVTMILKAMGEIAFRWSYGKPVIMTKGMNDTLLASFKNVIGNPTRDAWHIFPSEWVESFEMLSNNTGNLDLPAYLDKLIDFCVLATSIPKAVMMGDVQGVNTDNTVNNENYFALLGKVHNNDEPKLLEFFNKVLDIQ